MSITKLPKLLSNKVFTQFLSLDLDDLSRMTNHTRQLGLVVCRGTSVVVISPNDGIEEIANPFIQAE